MSTIDKRMFWKFTILHNLVRVACPSFNAAPTYLLSWKNNLAGTSQAIDPWLCWINTPNLIQRHRSTALTNFYPVYSWWIDSASCLDVTCVLLLLQFKHIIADGPILGSQPVQFAFNLSKLLIETTGRLSIKCFNMTIRAQFSSLDTSFSSLHFGARFD